MLLGVVSDTHGHLRNTQNAIRMLDSLEVAAVIHCGDIGSTAVVDLFGKWPTHFVLGNVDCDARALEMAIRAAGQNFCGSIGRMELAGKRIAFTHGHNVQLFRGAIADGQAELVCYGHTHHAEWHDEGQTRVLNPGAIFRASPHTIAVVDLKTLAVTIAPID